MKKCTKCKTTKPIADFYVRGDKKGSGLTSHCKACIKAKQKQRTPEQRKRVDLRHNFGITLEQYNEMLERQDHCCAICTRPETSFTRRLSVDHHHLTGGIRGLLCGDCNSGLGYFKDSPQLLENALYYLEVFPHLDRAVKNKEK